MELANQRVQFVLHGCKCKSGCTTRRCKCKKEGRTCGPGCQCISCKNTTSTNTAFADELHDLEVEDLRNEPDDDYSTDASDDILDSPDDLEGEVDTIMQSIFGDDESDEEF